jgi:hypothetical protein
MAFSANGGARLVIDSNGTGLINDQALMANTSLTNYGSIVLAQTAQTPDSSALRTGALSNTWSIFEYADRSTDFAFPLQANPTLVIQSSDATNVLQRIWINHNQTDGVIETGAGGISLRSFNGYTYIGNTGMTQGVRLSTVTDGRLMLNDESGGAIDLWVPKISTAAGALTLSPLQPNIIVGAIKPVTDGTPIDFVRIAVASGGHAHGTIWYSVFVSESGDTDLQSLQGTLTWSAVNEGGTVTCNIQKAGGAAAIESYSESDAASTLTTAFACVEDAADTMDISIDANTSFAAVTTMQLEYSVQTAEDYTVTKL